MRSVYDFFEALKPLEQQDSLTAIVEEGSKGLFVHVDVAGSALLEELKDVQNIYGPGLRFRAFNENVEVNWRGDYGVVVEGKVEQGQTIKLFIESDVRRHPGMSQFAAKVGALQGCQVRAAVLNKTGYLRLVEIIRGV